MNDRPGNDQNHDDDDGLVYEDLDDVMSWTRDEDLPPIDLDALDDEIEPTEHDETTGAFLESLGELDDEITPDTAPAEITPEESESLPEKPPEVARPRLRTLDLDALDDDLEPVEHDESTGALLESLDELDDEITPDAAPAETESLPEKPPEVARPRLRTLDLDALDDEIEPTEHDETTGALLESLGELDDEITAEAEPESPAADVTLPAIRPRPTPPVVAKPAEVYRVLITLPPDLGAQVLELREVGQITEMPPPGVELATAFHAADLPAVETALADWARANLPLQFEVTSIVAEVAGAQQYIAAWSLQPEEEVQEAQQVLMQTLGPLIEPLSDTPPRFQVRVIIGDHILPKPFPHVIGQMQQDFEPHVWYAETVSLLRAGPDEWETVNSFR